MGKWAKYSKKYNKDWEKDPLFKAWLQPTPDNLLNEGKSEAYCKLCRSTIRPQKNDLLAHKNTKVHREHEKALPSVVQPQLERFGYESSSSKTAADKITDLKLSMLVACHTSVKSIDHIGEVSRSLGKGSSLEELRLHRTKCSMIIKNVIAPALLQELVADVGDSFYSLIVDESTDFSVKKLLALCIKYHSKKNKTMIVTFLGIVETPQATAEKLYDACTNFLKCIGLDVKKLIALGTDGGNNMCGRHHSLFALLKQRDCPHLMLVKCTCHSLDKCASYASQNLPPSLEFLIRESRNWFSHSALRKFQYAELYKEMFGTDPPLLVKLATTRWLSFYGAVKTHLAQYLPLQELFKRISASPDKCQTATYLAELHNDANHLLLTFLKPVLEQLTRINLLFQHTDTDMTRAFSDLRIYVFSVAGRVLRDEALRQTARPGMLRLSELGALREALRKKDSLRSLDQVKYGDSFLTLAMTMERRGTLTANQIMDLKVSCANFLTTLSKELADRLPDCIEDIEKLRHFAPPQVLARRGRPEFGTLPIHLIPHKYDRDSLENQWTELGASKFEDICRDGTETLETIDTVKFWSLCLEMKNGAGQQPLKDLSNCVLALLSLPLSNAVVERVFSVMNIVKSKLRNRMSVSMLNAILFLRFYIKITGKCCTSFQPSEGMLRRFNARNMYGPRTQSCGREGDGDRAGNAAAESSGNDGPVAMYESAAIEPLPAVQGVGNQQPMIEFADDQEAIDAVLDLLENEDISNLMQ